MQNKQALFQTLFNRDFNDPGKTAYLQELTAAHPYFSPAQFYLLQCTDKNAEAYEMQANRTSILFNNPYWLNFQLQDAANAVAEPVVPQAAAPEEILISPDLQETEQHNTFIEPALANVEDADDTDEPADMETEIEPMKIELKMPEQSESLDEAMLIEPMHMVDYFASQGIKLSDEVQAGDKLGKQLKSFTEWLKTMKKVHPGQEAESIMETGDDIQQMAANSNTKAEVLTESMAEVFMRQGKQDKAAEVYQKLSLLNPAKSAYFAAKIENLKET